MHDDKLTKEEAATDNVGGRHDNDVSAESHVSRRRALLVGLAAAPAIITLMRRPVWAQATPSICDSIATSSLHAGITQADCDALNNPTSTP
jgi:hypothetical protein